MIRTKEQLEYYISEDAKANGIRIGINYWLKLFYGNIPSCAFRYLKSLRKYEYSLVSGEKISDSV